MGKREKSEIIGIFVSSLSMIIVGGVILRVSFIFSNGISWAKILGGGLIVFGIVMLIEGIINIINN